MKIHDLVIVTRPDGDDFFDADCPACLRGRAHTELEHDRAVLRANPDGSDCDCEDWACLKDDLPDEEWDRAK